MNHNLTPNVLTKRLPPDDQALTTYTLAAGTDDKNGPGVDMAGYQGIRFLVAMGAIVSGAVTSIKVQQSSDNGDADAYSDLEGTSISIADTDDGKLIISEIYRPLKRYVRLVIDRGTQNATVDTVIAELYGAGDRPITKDTTVATQELKNSPAEGTA